MSFSHTETPLRFFTQMPLVACLSSSPRCLPGAHLSLPSSPSHLLPQEDSWEKPENQHLPFCKGNISCWFSSPTFLSELLNKGGKKRPGHGPIRAPGGGI